ncbi:hypothetical protein [Arthrobacter sp. OAP107]
MKSSRICWVAFRGRYRLAGFPVILARANTPTITTTSGSALETIRFLK